MATMFCVFAGGRWRGVCPRSGRVAGWRGRARFLVARRGRLHCLQPAGRRRVLRGLRALAAGHAAHVADGPQLEQRRHYSAKHSPKKERPAHRHHCCCDAHKRALEDAASVTKRAAVSAATQTVATPAAGAASDRTPPPLRTRQKPCPLSKKRLLSADKPPKKHRSKPAHKVASPKADETVQTDTESQHCKELIINEDDVDALRNFLDKNNLFDVDLESFDADDDYKSKVFYKINPLVTVERCARIQRMYHRRNSNDISLADFATKLGLLAVTDVAQKKRYKMRKRDTVVSTSVESDKENRSDSSVSVLSDRSAEKNVALKTKRDKTGVVRKEPLGGQTSKNIVNKRPLQRDKQSNKNSSHKETLQSRKQSSSSSESEQSSSSVSSEADDSDNESSNSDESSDSAFESRSDHNARLRRSRKGSESKLRRSGRLSALDSPNRKGKELRKKPEADESNSRQVDLPVDRDVIKQPTKKNDESAVESKQKVNNSDRPLRRKNELELLQEQNEARHLKKYKLNERTNRKANESTSQSSSKKKESALLPDRAESESRTKNNASSGQNRRKSEVERLLNRSHSEPRAQKKNEPDSRLNPRNDSRTQSVSKRSEPAVRDESDSRPIGKDDESTSRQTRKRNRVDLSLNRNKSRSSSRKKSKLDSRPNRRAQSDSRSSQNKNESDARQKEKSDTKQKENKLNVINKENKLNVGHKGNKSDSRRKETSSTRHKNKSDALKSRNTDESDSQNESNSRQTRQSLSSPNKKVGGPVQGTRKDHSDEPKSLEEAKKQPLIPQAASNTSLSKFREYSSLEDHAIVAWISRGPRARQVNGNRVWRELQQEYSGLVGVARTWHSLRNRYLRYILPRLGALSISPPRAADLRAAAAKGEIKSHRRAPPPPPPRVLSAWAARPRGRLRTSSDSSDADDARNQKHNKHVSGEKKRLLETRAAGAWAARAPRDGSSSGSEPPRSRRSAAAHAPRDPPTPSYRELTRRFAPKLRSTPNSSPPPAPPPPPPPPPPHRSRRLYNPKAAL